MQIVRSRVRTTVGSLFGTVIRNFIGCYAAARHSQLLSLNRHLFTMRRATTSFVRRSHRQFSQAVQPTLQITTLPNKIRVATESTPGHFSSVGLYVDAGSRYEDSLTSGVSHFLDRMAFKVWCFRYFSSLMFTTVILLRPPTPALQKTWPLQSTS